MKQQLGHWLFDARWWVILGWCLLALGLRTIAPTWHSVALDGDLEQLPADTTTVRGLKLSARAFPDERSKSQIVLVFARKEAVLTPDDREFALHIARRIEALGEPTIVDVWTEKTEVVNSLLRSPQGRARLEIIRLTNEFMATDNIRVLSLIQDAVDQARPNAPAGLEIGITGSGAIGGDMLAAAAASVANTHRTTLLLVTTALLLIYRSPWMALVPLATIAISASVSFDVLAMLGARTLASPGMWPDFRVFTTTKIFVIVLLFGAGTDYCLFLTARYREQRVLGLGRRDAVSSALANVSVALAASAFTTIVGLAMMRWADFGKFAYSGPAIAVSLAITLAACLTFAPALMSTWLGTAIGRGDSAERAAAWNRLWERMADVVLGRPWVILFVSLMLLSPLAWVGWHTEVTYDLLGELDPSRVSRRGTNLLRQSFPPGEIGPLVVLAELHSADLNDSEAPFLIARLAKPLYELEGVDQVRSLYRPTGEPPGSVQLSVNGLALLAARGSPLTRAEFVSQAGELAGHVTRLSLVLEDEPFSAAAVETCDRVERLLGEIANDASSPWHGARFELLGPTPGIRDLERVTQADRSRIEVLVAGAVLVVIIVLLRKFWVCVYLIATVIFSYLVTMGIADLVFHVMRGEAYMGLDWKVPLFLFVILVAVGQDYNIYLVTRVLEEQRRLGPRAGLRRAFVQTGGIITSCGVIMAGTFVSMTTAELNGMIEIGFALTVGILLDTFLVRTIIVPAFLAVLAGKENG